MQRHFIQKVLELNYKKDEKVKISPIGDVVGFDKRGFKIDPNIILQSIAKNSVHIPLDENHSFNEAIGWFDKSSFELREDGIYALLEFNEKGEELLKNKSYRYLSPVYEMGSGGNVVGLDSVGFVNRPNLLNVELNKKEKNNMENEIEKLKAENESLKKELESFKADKSKDESKGENRQANANEGLESLKQDLEVIKTTLKETNKKINIVFQKGSYEKNDKTALSENDKKVAELLGLSEEEYAKSKEAK